MPTTHRELQSHLVVYTPRSPTLKEAVISAYSFSYKYYFTHLPIDQITLKLIPKHTLYLVKLYLVKFHLAKLFSVKL